MGGHGGLNILPQKKWNVYNFENREKVRKDEEAAAREEQLKREQSRKRDSELRLLQLRQARGVDPPDSTGVTPKLESQVEVAVAVDGVVASEKPKSDSKHINLLEGIKIFDPIEVIKKENEQGHKRKKMKEEVRVVGPEDEKYRLAYGVAGKGVKAPWYTMRPQKAEEEHINNMTQRSGNVNMMKKKKTVEELREERFKREKSEKERERALLLRKGHKRSQY